MPPTLKSPLILADKKKTTIPREVAMSVTKTQMQQQTQQQQQIQQQQQTQNTTRQRGQGGAAKMQTTQAQAMRTASMTKAPEAGTGDVMNVLDSGVGGAQTSFSEHNAMTIGGTKG
jgi:regulator of protease activity HflC (stomatin/prohibitin superfamily)